MSSSWLDDYISTLEVRDVREKANEDLYNSYARLADHNAGSVQAPTSTASNLPSNDLAARPKASRSQTTTPGNPNTEDNLAALRADFAASQRTISTLNAQIASLSTEITSLKASLSDAKNDAAQMRKQVAALENIRASWMRKLKDREEELKEQRRLVQNVQDEMVGLEMQLNVADSQKKEKERENEELIERYMRRVGQEADEVNRGSGWQ